MDVDKLKKRAERFGAVSPVMTMVQLTQNYSEVKWDQKGMWRVDGSSISCSFSPGVHMCSSQPSCTKRNCTVFANMDLLAGEKHIYMYLPNK